MSRQSRRILWVFIFILLLSLPAVAAPQAAGPEKSIRIVLKDGSELVGRIISEEAGVVRFRTLSGVEMTIDRVIISSLESVEIFKGRALRKDPNRTRLFLAPTARPLQAGEGYFSAYEIFLPYFTIGVTDFLALGGGMTLIPGLDGQMFYFAPKVTALHKENFDLAGGILYMVPPGGDSGLGILYGVGTFGNNRSALSVGLGWGFSGEGVANNPVLMIGGEIQVSNSVKLISENWIPFGSDFKIISLGVRFFGRNLAADFGLGMPTNSSGGGFPFIPWIGFTYNFGGRAK